MSTGETLVLPEVEAHHVLKVLRGRPGDALEAVDTGGRLFLAELGRGGEAAVLEQLEAPGEDGVDIVLYQAVPKGQRMDLVVEKATEVGVGRVVPLSTGRGVVKAGGGGKPERWRRVALAAARQSLRLRVPEVVEPVGFVDAVREAGGGGVLLHNAAGLPSLEEVVGGYDGPSGTPVGLFVGPEGGWEDGELRAASGAGVAFARLGPYRLRSETAGIVSVARTMAALESRMGEGEA